MRLDMSDVLAGDSHRSGGRATPLRPTACPDGLKVRSGGMLASKLRLRSSQIGRLGHISSD